jgi:hypothetical protein
MGSPQVPLRRSTHRLTAVKIDWGSVPAWAGGVSLLLAFRVFLRDRAKADRFQVETAGVWWDIDRPALLPGQPRNDDVKVRCHFRNGSELPVEFTYIAWEMDSRWSVPDMGATYLPPDDPHFPGVWDVKPGIMRKRMFYGPVRVPPQETINGPWQDFDVSELAPTGASTLDLHPDGLRCILRWVLVTDNAGRRWQTRHSAGRPARRIRWYNAWDPNFPYEWKNPLTRTLTRWWFTAEAKAKVLAQKAKRLIR